MKKTKAKTRAPGRAKTKKQEPPKPQLSLGLIALEPLFDLLKLVIWSGQVIGERPLSLVVVSPVASGKTSLLEKLECTQAHFVSDLTSRDIHNSLRNPKVTHVLLGDLLSLFGHKSHVVALTCRTLSTLTGESARTDTFTGEAISNGGRMLGLITGIPPEELQKTAIKMKLQEGGLSTRFIFARYRYRLSTIQKIHEWIKSDAYTHSEPLQFRVTGEPERVSIPPDIANVLRELAMGITQRNDMLGTRPHHHIRALAKAAALSCGRNEVRQEDVERVAAHSNFMTDEGIEL